jgi:hypothetical protein
MANVATLEKEIKTLRSNLENDAIPAEFKDNMKKQLEKLEIELAETIGKAAKPAVEKIVDKAEQITRPYTLHHGGSNDALSAWFPNDIEVKGIIEFQNLNSRANKISYFSFKNWDEAKQMVVKMVNDVYKEQDRWGKKTTEMVLDNLKSLVFFENKVNTKRSMYDTVMETWSELTDMRKTKPVKKQISELDYDCDDLIEKEKQRLAKRKKAEKKREAKPEPAKQRERVDKVTDVVENSIKERIASGKPVKKAEVEALIRQYEEAITDLKKILKTL